VSTIIKPLYGSTTAITITAASLGNGSYQQSASIDNTSALMWGAFLLWKIKTGAAGVSATGSASLYFYGYDGTNFSSGASGSNASFTPILQSNLVLLDTIYVSANAQTPDPRIIDVTSVPGLLMQYQKWGIILFNNTGAALDATAGNFLFNYQPLNPQNV
jgi:hypothetical protein